VLDQDVYYGAQPEECYGVLRDRVLPALAVEVRGKKGPVTLTRYVLGFELLEEDLDGLVLRGRLTTTGGFPAAIRTPELRLYAKRVHQDPGCFVLVKPTSDDLHSGAAMDSLYRANDAFNRALSRSEAGRAYTRLVTLTAYVDGERAIDAASFGSERGVSRELATAFLRAFARQVHRRLEAELVDI
jgi:hypothetical protein